MNKENIHNFAWKWCQNAYVLAKLCSIFSVAFSTSIFVILTLKYY